MFMQRKSTLEIEDNYRKHLIACSSGAKPDTYYRVWCNHRTIEELEREAKDFYDSFDSPKGS